MRSVSVIAALLAAVALSGCEPTAPQAVTAADKAQIEQEIKETVQNYVAAVKAGDLPRILSFWGDFEDFVHAGDGRVFGNHEKWKTWLRNNRPDEFLYWNNSDIHVSVLAPNAAAYTMNFESSFIKGGETVKITGSWTYVFRKTSAGWQVVQSNGTHVGWSYDE